MPTNELNLKGLLIGSADLNLGSDDGQEGNNSGVGIATLDGVSGDGLARMRNIGHGAAALADSHGDNTSYLDNLTGVAVGARHYVGVGSSVLDDLIGDSLSTLTAISIKPTDVCFTQKNATPISSIIHGITNNAVPLTRTICGLFDSALPLNIELCSSWSNAERLQADSCAFVDDASPLSAQLCIDNFAAIPVSAEVCASWKNAILIPEVRCSKQTSATHITHEVCARTNDSSARNYYETVTVHPEGVSTLPSSNYILQPYTGDFETRSTRHQFVTSRNVFKLDNPPQTSLYELEHYDVDTWYRGHDTFPPSSITYPAERLPERQWVQGANDPYEVVEMIAQSPLSSGFCDTQQQATILNRESCSHVDEATHLFTNTCIPFLDVTQVLEPPPPDPDPPLTGETVVVPTQEVYTVQNIVSAKLEDDTNIDVTNVRLAFDVSSHSWQWSANLLDPSQEDLVKPASNGSEVRLIVTINTESWLLLVERTRTNRRFNSNVISMTGRGIGALLDAPYQPKANVTETSVATNQQIAESFLPSGWTITWSMPTWNVPANTYSHQNLTPLEALKRLVDDCGGMLIPSRNSQAFTVRPRYPVLPWNFSLVNPDLIVPDDVITALAEEPVAAYGANGVYVHGLDGGKQALCLLTGTAGERLADTVSNAFMVDTISIRAKGEAALAAAYVQPKIRSIETFMDGGTIVPLVEVGTFVAFDISGAEDRGIVNSVTVSTDIDDDGVITVNQALIIGEDTENTFSMFSKLLPSDPLQVVTIISSSGDRSLVETVDGNQLNVRGTGTANARFYMRGGQLEGAAPVLSVLSDIIV